MIQKHRTLLPPFKGKWHLSLEKRGAGGEVSAHLGTYCTSLSPVNTITPVYAYNLLRTKYGPAGHTGRRGRRAVWYHHVLNHMGFRRLCIELWPPGPVTFLTQEPLESEEKGESGSCPQTAGCGDSGLWGRVHTPYEVTGMGSAACPGQQGAGRAILGSSKSQATGAHRAEGEAHETPPHHKPREIRRQY